MTESIYTRVTNSIIAAIEKGAGECVMPWNQGGFMPVNAASNNAYRGINTLILLAAAREKGYISETWATYKQWQEKGAQVRKGEKGEIIVFWKTYETEEMNDNGEEESKTRMVARAYTVFNAEQVDGYEIPKPIENTAARIAEAESFFSSINARIKEEGTRAFYSPATDTINMPLFSLFRDAESYYSVLSHEVMHWTGHKSRIARDFKNRFGSQGYAAEELVAELGSAFLCAQLGMENEPHPDHAAYVANWLTILKNDDRAIFTAASKAQQAVDWINAHRNALAMAA